MKKFMLHKNIFRLIFAFYLSTSLAACGGVKESLGITKDAPDEFSVIRHAPLEIPTALVLPPPNPGQPRPQEQAATAQAKEVIFGNEAKSMTESQESSAEAVLLQKTGVSQIDPNIRRTLNEESDKIEEKNRPVAQKLLSFAGKKTENLTETLDPKAEAERLKEKNLPTTELPVKEQKKPEWNKSLSHKE